MAARREPFFALEAKPVSARLVIVVAANMDVYAVMSATGGGSIYLARR